MTARVPAASIAARERLYRPGTEPSAGATVSRPVTGSTASDAFTKGMKKSCGRGSAVAGPLVVTRVPGRSPKHGSGGLPTLTGVQSSMVSCL